LAERFNLSFTAELLAPCGMNCALCSAYLAGIITGPPGARKMTQCKGCRPRGKKCAFIKRDCEQLGTGKVDSCHECATFPCKKLQQLDKRYRRNYSYSMVDTLRSVQSRGIAEVLKTQRERYRCSRCGGVICVHNGKCYSCDKVKSWRG
jgi:hypothetical protein